MRSSTSYRPTICGQSVAAALGASACTAAIAACSAYGAEAGRDERPLDQRRAFGDRAAVPARAVLLVERDQLAVGGRARARAPRFVQQHQREQADRLRLGQQRDEQPASRIASPDRSAASAWPDDAE